MGTPTRLVRPARRRRAQPKTGSDQRRKLECQLDSQSPFVLPSHWLSADVFPGNRQGGCCHAYDLWSYRTDVVIPGELVDLTGYEVEATDARSARWTRPRTTWVAATSWWTPGRGSLARRSCCQRGPSSAWILRSRRST